MIARSGQGPKQIRNEKGRDMIPAFFHSHDALRPGAQRLRWISSRSKISITSP
ncbi:hypothetical protein SAMN05519105_0290 [Rhodobacter sp. 24-YEA-8]|nr:hypothetical protein SAMN05519105_0290 [Rhodobacter sp. 24-YEA-8]